MTPANADPCEPDAAASYEHARDELAAVVAKLESGGLSLDESLALWERGEQLAAICTTFLDGARERVDLALATSADRPESCRTAVQPWEFDASSTTDWRDLVGALDRRGFLRPLRPPLTAPPTGGHCPGHCDKSPRLSPPLPPSTSSSAGTAAESANAHGEGSVLAGRYRRRCRTSSPPDRLHRIQLGSSSLPPASTRPIWIRFSCSPLTGTRRAEPHPAAHIECGRSSGINIAIAPDVGAVGRLVPVAYSTTPIPEAQITAAVARVDGSPQNVMTQSGIPGWPSRSYMAERWCTPRASGSRRSASRTGQREHRVPARLGLKSVGTTVVAQAVSEGPSVVRPDREVPAGLPAVRPIRHADGHHRRYVCAPSGIPAGAGDDLEGIGFAREQIIRSSALFPLNPFRTATATPIRDDHRWRGGRGAAGKSWEDLSQQLIYGPLGMTATSSRYADFLAGQSRNHSLRRQRHLRAAVHPRRGRPIPRRGGELRRRRHGQMDADEPRAGKVDGEQLIDADALLEAHTPQIVNPGRGTRRPQPLLRLRLQRRDDLDRAGQWGHSGAFYVGAGTAFAMLPAADVGIVALTNASPVGAAETITSSFADLARRGTSNGTGSTSRSDLRGAVREPQPGRHTPAPANPAPARPPPTTSAPTPTMSPATLLSPPRRNPDGAGRPERAERPLNHYDGEVFSGSRPVQR